MYHVVAYTRQEYNEGGNRFLGQLSDRLIQRMTEVTDYIDALRAAGNLNQLNIPSEHVEVLSIHTFPFEEYHAVRGRFGGEDAFLVLFLNDPARVACAEFRIDVRYVAEVPDAELPENLGVALSLENYRVPRV